MFEEHGFDEFADGCLFLGGEVAGGFEGEGEVVLGAAFVWVEDEAVDGDGVVWAGSRRQARGRRCGRSDSVGRFLGAILGAIGDSTR